MKSLNEIVHEKSFDDYAVWWPMGRDFISCMSYAIMSEWLGLINDRKNRESALATVNGYVADYIRIVFKREMRVSLVDHFIASPDKYDFLSGEFDAISYGFYRSSFETIEQEIDSFEGSLERERRLFTKRVGKLFFDQVRDHLDLTLPDRVVCQGDFYQLKSSISVLGSYLSNQGYLRDGCSFDFHVDIQYQGNAIQQTEQDALNTLCEAGMTYALFEMGYPAILPSAVYLYHTIGEAQHHSSRTIEALFHQVGFIASETDDFDPIGYPADKVVELWEIRSNQAS